MFIPLYLLEINPSERGYIDVESVYNWSFYWFTHTMEDRGFDSGFTLGLF